jgi:hypothetical protein
MLRLSRRMNQQLAIIAQLWCIGEVNLMSSQVRPRALRSSH